MQLPSLYLVHTPDWAYVAKRLHSEYGGSCEQLSPGIRSYHCIYLVDFPIFLFALINLFDILNIVFKLSLNKAQKRKSVKFYSPNHQIIGIVNFEKKKKDRHRSVPMGKKKSKSQVRSNGTSGAAASFKKATSLPPLGNKLGSTSFTAINTLTKPALFSFYDEDITKNEGDVYDKTLLSNASQLEMAPPIDAVKHERSLYVKILNFIAAVSILFITGVLFPMVSECLFDNDQLAKGDIVSFLQLGIVLKNKFVSGPRHGTRLGCFWH